MDTAPSDPVLTDTPGASNRPNRRRGLLLLVVAAGCALYSDVSIGPLSLLPNDISRGSDLADMVAKGDYLRAVAAGKGIEAKEKPSYKLLAHLGEAELAMGRLDEARRHLRQALDLRPFHTVAADIAWNLSQTEYLDDNFAASLEWANEARRRGLNIRQWHLDYLEAMSEVRAYEIPDKREVRLRMKIRDPIVPRVEARLNGVEALAVLDSGAVLSIVSTSFADRIGLRSLGKFKGTFYGLLGEPIPVSFGLADRLALGELEIRNVPVAIMDDRQLRFLGAGKRPYQIHFLLGANLLKELRLDLDFGDERLTLTPLKASDYVPHADQNLFFVGFRPFVHAAINKKGWYLFVLDTGSEVTFLNEEELEGTPVRLRPRIHGATLQGLGGAKKRGLSAESVEIGVDRWAGTFRTLPLYSAETTRARGILGQNFLKNFHVVIDFGRMRVDLERR